MKGRPLIWLVMPVSLYVAAILDAGLSRHIVVFGAAPDFLLILIAIFGMKMNRSGAMVFGFFDGLVAGGLIGADVQHLIAGRVIAGLIAGSIAVMGVDYSLFALTTCTIATTFAAEIIHLLLAPPPHVAMALGDTLITAIYNGVLAVPTYALYRRYFTSSVRLTSN